MSATSTGDPGDTISRHIRKFYDQQTEREWARMDRHRTEFAVTLRALAAHLPPPPAWDAWVTLNWRLAADPTLHSGAEHLLAVAVKPRWPKE